MTAALAASISTSACAAFDLCGPSVEYLGAARQAKSTSTSAEWSTAAHQVEQSRRNAPLERSVCGGVMRSGTSGDLAGGTTHATAQRVRDLQISAIKVVSLSTARGSDTARVQAGRGSIVEVAIDLRRPHGVIRTLLRRLHCVPRPVSSESRLIRVSNTSTESDLQTARYSKSTREAL